MDKYCSRSVCLANELFAQSDDSLSPETRDDIGLVISATHTTNFHVNDLLTVIKLRDGSLTSGMLSSVYYSLVSIVPACIRCKYDVVCLCFVCSAGAEHVVLLRKRCGGEV